MTSKFIGHFDPCFSGFRLRIELTNKPAASASESSCYLRDYRPVTA